MLVTFTGNSNSSCRYQRRSGLRLRRPAALSARGLAGPGTRFVPEPLPLPLPPPFGPVGSGSPQAPRVARRSGGAERKGGVHLNPIAGREAEAAIVNWD